MFFSSLAAMPLILLTPIAAHAELKKIMWDGGIEKESFMLLDVNEYQYN